MTQSLTIHVAPEMHDDLSRMAAARGITIQDLIRQSLALEAFLWERQQAGSEILMCKGGHLKRIELVPVTSDTDRPPNPYTIPGWKCPICGSRAEGYGVERRRVGRWPFKRRACTSTADAEAVTS